MKSKYISLKPLLSYHEETRPINWAKAFNNQNPINVEIGFGNGEFLLRLAKEEENYNIVGLEQIWERVTKTLRRISHENIENVKVLLIDAHIALERLFLPGSINQIYCLFPCPWPKKGHIKYRLFSNEFFKLVNSRLTNDGQIKIVTDYLPYRDWLLEQYLDTGFTLSEKTIKPTYDTKYERKWLNEGQKEFFELQFKKDQGIKIPFKEDVELKTYMVDSFDPNNFNFEDQRGDVTIIFKELVYDEKRQKALLYFIVSEEGITQNVWLAVVKQNNKWCVCPATGHRFIPTTGVAQTLKRLKDSCSYD